MRCVQRCILKTLHEIIKIPSEKILNVQSENDNIVVYYITNNNSKLYGYEFRIHGTGYDVGDDLDNFIFLNSVKMYNDSATLHVFYRNL